MVHCSVCQSRSPVGGDNPLWSPVGTALVMAFCLGMMTED